MTDLTPKEQATYERIARQNGTTVEEEMAKVQQAKLASADAADKRAPLLYEAPVRTHEQQVERSLKQIAVFTGIVAISLIVGIVLTFLSGLAGYTF